MIAGSPARALGTFLAGIFALFAATGMAATADTAAPAQVRETEAGMGIHHPRWHDALHLPARRSHARQVQMHQYPLHHAERTAIRAGSFAGRANAEDLRGQAATVPGRCGCQACRRLVVDRPGQWRQQWAYKGSPLYTSMKDRKPGDVNGEGIVAMHRVAAGACPVGVSAGFQIDPARRRPGSCHRRWSACLCATRSPYAAGIHRFRPAPPADRSTEFWQDIRKMVDR